MLFNPRWKAPKTKADPFTVASLIAWLEHQPADRAYCYSDPQECGLVQFFEAQGFRDIEMIPGSFTHAGGREPFPPVFDFIASEGEHTFGAALARARAIN